MLNWICLFLAIYGFKFMILCPKSRFDRIINPLVSLGYGWAIGALIQQIVQG